MTVETVPEVEVAREWLYGLPEHKMLQVMVHAFRRRWRLWMFRHVDASEHQRWEDVLERWRQDAPQDPNEALVAREWWENLTLRQSDALLVRYYRRRERLGILRYP